MLKVHKTHQKSNTASLHAQLGEIIQFVETAVEEQETAYKVEAGQPFQGHNKLIYLTIIDLATRQGHVWRAERPAQGWRGGNGQAIPTCGLHSHRLP